MVREFVPEMRSDKKDAEIARLRANIDVLKNGLGLMVAHFPYWASLIEMRQIDRDVIHVARAALAATEEK